MSIDLPHLASRLFNRPHMIAGAKLDVILSAVAPRIFDGQRLPLSAFADGEALSYEAPPEAYRVSSGVAVLPVHGTLIRRGGWLNAMSGLTSYEGLLASFREAMMDGDVKAVLLDIDSSGGEAGGVFDLVEEMRALSSKHNKPVWAHANEEAASAAYAIACAASQIWVARTGDMGSIGVVCAHIDQSKQDEKQGLKWTFIYCGEHKIHGNPHQPLADEAYAKIQADSDYLYEMFIELVADYRPMSAAAVRDTKADTFIGEEAVKRCLADRVGTFDEALTCLIDQVNRQDNKAAEGTNSWPDVTGSKMSAKKILKKKTASKTRKMRKKTPTPKTLTKSTMPAMKTKIMTPKRKMKSTTRKMRMKPNRAKHVVPA